MCVYDASCDRRNASSDEVLWTVLILDGPLYFSHSTFDKSRHLFPKLSLILKTRSSTENWMCFLYSGRGLFVTSPAQV